MDKYSLYIFYSDEDGGYIVDIPDLDSPAPVLARPLNKPWPR